MTMDKAIKVLLGPSSFAEIDKAPLERLLNAGFEVVDNPYKRKLTRDDLLELLQGVKGLIAGLEPLDRVVLEKSGLRVISRCGSGMTNVDLGAAQELGIIVRNTPLAPITAVAELTIGCMLSLLRQVPQADRDLHGKNWSKRIGRQLDGSCVGVIGFGNIGRKVAQLLLSFGARVIAVDPLSSGIEEGIPIVSLDEALKSADIVSLHSSNDSCILSEREFEMMKHGSYVLNAARGSLIDEEALRKALDSGRVTGAWVDTFNQEPYKGILCDYQQVILTPHIGSYTVECRSSMEMEAAENLINSFEEMGYGTERT